MIRPNRFMGAADEFTFDTQLKGKIYDELKQESSGDDEHAI